MNDTLRLNRRLLLGAAGALSVVSGMFGADVRAAASKEPAQQTASPDSVLTEFVLEARVNIGPLVNIGASAYGVRRLIPITGGSFRGPRLRGEVVPGGADYQVVRPDGVTTVEAKYTLRASDGALIYIANRGIIVRGEAPGPSGDVTTAYVRTAPEFEAPIGLHDWLNKSLFVGTLDASNSTQGYVVIRIFRIV
jgi:hypothetical protein